MKYLSLFVLTIVYKIVTSYKCDIKQCASKHLVDGVCVTPVKDTTKDIVVFDINVANCESGKFCPFKVDATNDVQCEIRSTKFGRYEGQPCKNNIDCASNDCVDSKCLGKAEGQPCDTNSQCRVGYFCGTKDLSSGIKNCLKQRELNSPCENDEDCQNNMGCLNDKCYEYFSIKTGTFIKNGNWKLCETGKVYNSFCVSTKLEQDTQECKGDQIFCKYSLEGIKDEKSFNLKCQCSNAYADRNFCDIDSANSEWVKFIEKLKDWYYQHNKNYHTDSRHNYHMDLYKRYKIMTEYPQHKDADVCLVDWELDYLSSGYLRNGFISVTIAIAMFIL